ncbi:hypothetical protein Hanom_Chr14g01300431 [Helianthus anomalus]
MPAITSSQTSALLPPIPPPYQKNADNTQKKTSSVFQGSKIKSYMEQQDKTNQRILREIDEIKKHKRPAEDHSPLVPRMLDFVTLANAAQQSRMSNT